MDMVDWGIGAPADTKLESVLAEEATSPATSPTTSPASGAESSPTTSPAAGAESSPAAKPTEGAESSPAAKLTAGAESSPAAKPTEGAESSLKRNAAQAGMEETAAVAPQVRMVTSATAALSRNENTREGKMSYREEQLALLGMAAPPRNFTNADKKAWTKEERSTYNFQCQMHGPTYASGFMRNYFKENEGKPLPPTAPPRSAYAIFRLERFAEIGCSAGGFMGTGKKKKNYSKQVGNEWTELSEEQQQPYEVTFAAKVEEHEKATEAYEAALEQWEQQKGQPVS
jgi:hypothetical protein